MVRKSVSKRARRWAYLTQVNFFVGMGRIWSAVARRARGFDMKVMFFDPGLPRDVHVNEGAARCGSLDEMLREADFVSIHAPHTPDTCRMIGANELRAMKPTSILVNTSRGTIVDTEALVAALKICTIAGAALDVTDPEPLPQDHPLACLRNCIVVPHIGSASYVTRARMSDIVAENLLTALDGETPPDIVNVRAESRS